MPVLQNMSVGRPTMAPTAPAAAKKVPKQTAGPDTKPFLRFHYFHELRTKTL